LVSVLIFLAPLCHAQNERAFFDLYNDWNPKLSVDYNLDGRVDYWDALCLSYLWSHQSCHRFYMAGGGTGGTFQVMLSSTTREQPAPGGVMSQPPVAVLRPSVESGGLSTTLMLALPPVEIDWKTEGKPLPGPLPLTDSQSLGLSRDQWG